MASFRALHWVFKIGNLKRNVAFFETVLGMHVLRHEEFGSGCEAQCNGPYARPWSKTMMGYGPESSHFVLELTYNYGVKSYAQGNDLSYLSVNASGVLPKAREFGSEVIETEGQTYVLSPDGYRFLLTDQAPAPAVKELALNVADIALSVDYYSRVLGMEVLARDADSASLSYGQGQCALLLCRADGPIDHAKAFGRVAFACPSVSAITAQVRAAGDRIHTEPVRLDTPGKATVEVVILSDRDGYEICMVGAEGFAELSTTKPGDEYIDWAARAEKGADC